MTPEELSAPPEGGVGWGDIFERIMNAIRKPTDAFEEYVNRNMEESERRALIAQGRLPNPRGGQDYPDQWQRTQSMPQPGALSPAPMRRAARSPVAPPAAAAPQGALAQGTDPWEQGVVDSANQNASMAIANEGQPVGALAAPARKGLAEQYRERMAGIREPEAGLTPEQQKKMRLDFFLNIMARSSKPGARFIGAAGEAGLDTSRSYDQSMKEARSIAERKAGQQREDAFREVTLSDKDEDNQARQRQLGISEEHYRNMDARDAERLKIVQQQMEQGNWQLIPAKGKGGATYQFFDRKTMQVRDTGIKIPDAGGGTDNRPDAVKLYEYIKKLPPEEQDKFLKTVGKGEKHGEPTATDVFKASMDRIKGDMTGKMTPEQAYRETRRLATLSTGAASAPTSVKRESKEWKEALADPRIGGDVKKLEAILKQAGIEITK